MPQPTHIELKTQHVLVLRKAIAIALLYASGDRGTYTFSPPEQVWLSEVERMLWPGWSKDKDHREPRFRKSGAPSEPTQ